MVGQMAFQHCVSESLSSRQIHWNDLELVEQKRVNRSSFGMKGRDERERMPWKGYFL